MMFTPLTQGSFFADAGPLGPPLVGDQLRNRAQLQSSMSDWLANDAFIRANDALNHKTLNPNRR